MAGSLNKVMLVGNIGNDPEIKHSQDGSKIVTFNLATSESWRDKSGEKKEKTEWHRIVIFSQGLAEVAEKYLRKGSKVYIEGQLRTRKWQDQSGADRYSTEVVLSGFGAYMIMLDRLQGGEGSNNYGSASSGGSSGSNSGSGTASSGWDNSEASGGSSSVDDEIPF